MRQGYRLSREVQSLRKGDRARILSCRFWRYSILPIFVLRLDCDSMRMSGTHQTTYTLSLLGYSSPFSRNIAVYLERNITQMSGTQGSPHNHRNRGRTITRMTAIEAFADDTIPSTSAAVSSAIANSSLLPIPVRRC